MPLEALLLPDFCMTGIPWPACHTSRCVSRPSLELASLWGVAQESILLISKLTGCPCTCYDVGEGGRDVGEYQKLLSSSGMRL